MSVPQTGLTSAPASYPDWEYQVLAGLGIPNPKPAALQALSLWAQSEGVNPANNNWLATTLKGPSYPTSGVVAQNGGDAVPAYSSQAVGVAATVATIKQYPAIVNALSNSAGLQGIFLTINDSKWCAGCQGGLYPVALADAVNKASPGSVGPGNTTPSSAPTAETPPCSLKIGPYCVLNQQQLQKVLGGTIAASGVAIMGLGLILVFAFGLKSTSAGRAAASAARRIPGPFGTTARAASGGRSSSSGGAGPSVDDVAGRAKHGPPRGGSRPRGSSVKAKHAIAEHNRQEDAEQSHLRAEGRAQDRRNASSTSPRPRQPASSTAGG